MLDWRCEKDTVWKRDGTHPESWRPQVGRPG